MEMGRMHYKSLAWMAALSFISMFVLMYAMVDAFSDVYANSNQLYMAALMTAPMVLIELAVMRAMYTDKRLNTIILSVAAVVLVAALVMIRQQIGVGDRQFVRAMIPHHGAAVLMCKQAPISDQEIQNLCRNIVTNQESEIVQMKKILDRLNRQ